MDKSKRLDHLVRQGLLPVEKLPILKRGLERISKGQNLLPNERDIIKQFLEKTTGFMFGDDVNFNRAKQYTQKNRYRVEENDMENSLDEKVVDGVEILDGEEMDIKGKKQEKKMEKDARKSALKDMTKGIETYGKGYSAKANEETEINENEDEMLSGDELRLKNQRIAKRISRRARKATILGKELRRQKRKAGLLDELKQFNEDYKQKFDAMLTKFNVKNVRDLKPEDKKKFFNALDKVHVSDKEEKGMDEGFKRYNVTHKQTGKKYQVMAMHKNSAVDKARRQHGGTASRYSGTGTSDFHVEEYVNTKSLEEQTILESFEKLIK